MRSWFLGHNHDWISFGAWSNGNPYQIPEQLYYSFPVTVEKKNWRVVPDLQISAEQRAKMDKTTK